MALGMHLISATFVSLDVKRLTDVAEELYK
jgi:hypothetical protein